MGAKFKIEKGGKIPSVGQAKEKPITYPFSQMEPGDNFFVPVGRMNDLRENRRIYAHVSYDARRYRKRHDRHFSVSIRTEKGGFRVWRVT